MIYITVTLINLGGASLLQILSYIYIRVACGIHVSS